MSSIGRPSALEHFTWKAPTTAAASQALNAQFQEIPLASVKIPPLAMPGLEVFAGPLVRFVVPSPQLQMVWVDNVTSWTDSIPFTTSPLFDDVPSLQSETQEFVQLAAQLSIDGAAGELESTEFSTLDALLQAEVDMLYMAVLKQLFAYSGKPGGFTTFFDLASTRGAKIDADQQYLSFELLECLIQQIGKYGGHPLAITIVLSSSYYRQFVSLMMRSGVNTRAHDPVTGFEHWFFDGVRVMEAPAIMREPDASTAWAVIYRVHGAALPEEAQRVVPASLLNGFAMFQSGPGGAVFSRKIDDGAPDRVITTVQVTAGAGVPPQCVATIDNGRTE